MPAQKNTLKINLCLLGDKARDKVTKEFFFLGSKHFQKKLLTTHPNGLFLLSPRAELPR